MELETWLKCRLPAYQARSSEVNANPSTDERGEEGRNPKISNKFPRHQDGI
jgi:hypothetical protein